MKQRAARAVISAIVALTAASVAPIAIGQGVASAGVVKVKVLIPARRAAVSGVATINCAVSPQVRRVELFEDGHHIASGPPYLLHWDTTRVRNGRHLIAARAYSSQYRLIGLSQVMVNVRNQAATPTPEPTPTPAPTPSPDPTPAPKSSPTPAPSPAPTPTPDPTPTPTPSYFGLKPIDAALPSGSACASEVLATGDSEEVPGNVPYEIVPGDISSYLSALAAGDLPNTAPASDFTRVDGRFVGTSYQTLRWGACKWGLDELTQRAQAYVESNWRQWEVSGGDTFGIMQIKDSPGYFSMVVPFERDSMPFNVDFQNGWLRSCINGDMSGYFKPLNAPVTGCPHYGANDMNSSCPLYEDGISAAEQQYQGCLGAWYSGRWYDAAAISYVETVQKTAKQQPWRRDR